MRVGIETSVALRRPIRPGTHVMAWSEGGRESKGCPRDAGQKELLALCDGPPGLAVLVAWLRGCVVAWLRGCVVVNSTTATRGSVPV